MSAFTAANTDLNDEFGYIEAPSEEQVARARRVVASMAIDVDDARELMSMLGIDAV